MKPSTFDLVMFLLPIVSGAVILTLLITGVIPT